MEQAQINNIEFRIVYAVMAVIAIMLALVAYWAFWPVDVLDVKQLPVPVTSPENIKSGRLILLKFNYCKYSDVEGVVYPQLVSERLVLDLPSYSERLKKSCSKVDAPVILPYTVATQTFHIHYKIVYPVNPVREVVEEFDTASFDIVPVPLDELQKGE